MHRIDNGEYHIIGMSPGNSYFKDDEIRYLLRTLVGRFGRAGVLIADIPAIATYIALGYPENRARRDKAIPKGNALKNRIAKMMTELGYTGEQIRVFDWEGEVEHSDDYRASYARVRALYATNERFRLAADATTQAVLESSGKSFSDIHDATGIAVHYLLSEFAFLEFAPGYLGVERVTYVYHKNWPVYEAYLAGTFDGMPRANLDFLLIENPYETYRSLWDDDEAEEVAHGPFVDTLDRIERTRVIRVSFQPYWPAIIHDPRSDRFSGIFADILAEIARRNGWRLRWCEEVGYGVIVDGLEEDRFDIFGSTVWPTPEREQSAECTESVFESLILVWVRPGFQGTEEALCTDEHLRVVVKENDISDSIAMSDFPRNRKVQIPQLGAPTEVLRAVSEDRADFTFAERILVDHFYGTSPGKLVAVSERPIRVYGNTFMLRRGELRWKDFLNAQLQTLQEEGFVASLLERYLITGE